MTKRYTLIITLWVRRQVRNIPSPPGSVSQDTALEPLSCLQNVELGTWIRWFLGCFCQPLILYIHIYI